MHLPFQAWAQVFEWADQDWSLAVLLDVCPSQHWPGAWEMEDFSCKWQWPQGTPLIWQEGVVSSFPPSPRAHKQLCSDSQVQTIPVSHFCTGHEGRENKCCPGPAALLFGLGFLSLHLSSRWYIIYCNCCVWFLVNYCHLLYTVTNVCEHFCPVCFTVPHFLAIQTTLSLLRYSYLWGKHDKLQKILEKVQFISSWLGMKEQQWTESDPHTVVGRESLLLHAVLCTDFENNSH